MEELDTQSTEVTTGNEQAEGFDFSQLGQYCPFNWTPEPLYTSEEVYVPEEYEDDGSRDLSPLSENARKAIMDLDRIFSDADIAPRRIEIEQAWRAYHYDRGYQFLLRDKRGGWVLPGTNTGYGAGAQQQMSSLYHTNVYGEKGEIITAAIAREVPKVEFFPANPEHAPDQSMSDVAEDLKDIWAKNNDLQKLLQDAAKEFWNAGRVLFWTYYELNGEEYGYEEPDQPVVPENESNPPSQPSGDEGSIEYQEENESPVDAAAKRRPRGRVRTVCKGKLDHQVPIYVDGQPQMISVAVYEDKDIATAKSQFPWMADKVQGGGDGTGQTQLDRIARENVRQAVPGQYVTGDSLNRHSVVKHRWMRPQAFYDAGVKEAEREELLAKFPDGVLLVKASTEFCYARNESMDDHITIGHPFPGKGQNRRALGESMLPIQDYINELLILALDFAKRTVAKKWMDSEAFNVEALKTQNNIPGSIGPFLSQPGKTVDQLIFIEPTPTPQPYLITFIQWIITSLSEQISGAMPSLFGAAITGQVGSEGVAIQRDQALQRVGCPWNSLQSMFAQAARQAAMLIAKCANKDINDVIPSKGRVSIKLNDLKGNVLCYPEANPEFPESWAQKEQRMKELLDVALKSPDAAISAMILDPKNLTQFQSALRLKGLVIKGAASVQKQEAEFEILLRSGPAPNPQLVKMQQALGQAQEGMKTQLAQHVTQGTEPTPEEQQQLQSAPALLNQLQQQMSSLPPEVSTVAIRDDASEDHTVEAAVCFDWLNSPDGRKFEYGKPEQREAFQNVLLHWKEHTAAATKLAAQNAPPPAPPKVSFSGAIDKLPPKEAAAVVTAGGIPANPADFGEQDQQETQAKIAQKVVPDTVWANQQRATESSRPPGK